MKYLLRQSRAFVGSGTGALVFVLVLLLVNAVSARAQDVTAVFAPPSGPMVAGSRSSLWLYCFNNSSNYISRSFEPSLNCTLTWQAISLETVLLLNTSSSPRTATIAPGGFVKEEYLLDLPLTSSGQVTLDIQNYNQVTTIVQPASEEFPSPKHSVSTPRVPGSELREYFANHMSFYEPIYFILGSAPAGEFQFSLKYKLLEFRDNWDPLTHLYLAYTQTSFWSVFSKDPSFYDTSYKPSMFFYYPDLFQKEFFQFDLQFGGEHESNGRGGTLERSFNTFYLQPKATFDLPFNFQFFLEPRAWFYYRVGDNNANIADYHGYADLLTALTWLDPNSAERIQFSTKLTIGDDGSHAGLLYDLRFNLAGVAFLRKFNPSFQVQYFTGYGQNLLQYDENSHALRGGLCLWY